MIEPEKVFLLPEAVLRQLLAYLETRPYREVVGGVGLLKGLREQEAKPGLDGVVSKKITKSPPTKKEI